MLSNNGLCLRSMRCVTIFSTGSKFRPVSNFMELHAPTLAARSYALLIIHTQYYHKLEYIIAAAPIDIT